MWVRPWPVVGDTRPDICSKRSADGGLVYVVQATNNPGRSSQTPGSFYVFAGCAPSKVNEVVDEILLNIARLQGTSADMQEDWFNRSKLLINTADALDNETPAAQGVGGGAG